MTQINKSNALMVSRAVTGIVLLMMIAYPVLVVYLLSTKAESWDVFEWMIFCAVIAQAIICMLACKTMRILQHVFKGEEIQ